MNTKFLHISNSYLITVLTVLAASISQFFTVSAHNPYVNPTGDEFPIVGWSTFDYADMITLKNYQNFKDAGFNIAYWYQGEYMTQSAFKRALEICDQLGIKVQIQLNSSTRQEDQYYIDKINQYKDYPATIGWALWDEPTVRQFGELRYREDFAKNYINPGQYLTSDITNIGANLSTLLAPSFRCYTQTYMLAIDPEMLSFDHYPIMLNDDGKMSLAYHYFEGLEYLSRVAIENDIPLWTFMLGTPHRIGNNLWEYPTPTLGHLSFEAFTGLAYGSQCLQYFCYGYRQPKETFDFQPGAVNRDGSLNPCWESMKTVNHQVQSMAQHFLGMKLNKVWHTGLQKYPGTTDLVPAQLPYPITNITAGKEGVVISYFSNNDNKYIFIVNKDFSNSQNVEIQYNKQAEPVKQLFVGASSGTSVDNGKIRVSLNPGSAILLQL